MITKKELAIRLCSVESDLEFALMNLHDLEKRVKKLEKPEKKTVKKAKKNV